MEVSIDITVIIQTLYTLLVMVPCAVIYAKSRHLYQLSMHRGIHLFGSAFLMFTLAFFMRWVTWAVEYARMLSLHNLVLILFVFAVLFIYLLTLGALMLVYSMVYKRFETRLPLPLRGTHLLHLIAFTTALLTIFVHAHIVFLVTIGTMVYGVITTYHSYKKNPKRSSFRQIYFIALVMALLGFLANFLSTFIVPFFPRFIFYAYIITILTFVIIWYAVWSITGKHGKEA